MEAFHDTKYDRARVREIFEVFYYYDCNSGIIKEPELQGLFNGPYRERVLHQLEWDLLCAREWASTEPGKCAQDHLDNCRGTLIAAFCAEYDSLDTWELVTDDDLAVRRPPPLQLSDFIP